MGFEKPRERRLVLGVIILHMFVCFETWFACVDHTDLELCVAQDGLKLMHQPRSSASLALGLQACSAAPARAALVKLDCSCVSCHFLEGAGFVVFLITCF